jgi:SAM-dependent methyltransferase
VRQLWCCPKCESKLDSACINRPGIDCKCHACGFQIFCYDGFPCFAPEHLGAVGGFDPALFEMLARIEETNFWFVNRARLIVALLRTYFPTASNILEVGCGTGSVLLALHRAMPKLRLVGSELHPRGLQIARKRLDDALLVQLDARRIPARSEFDVIGAFDVIEHINEDDAVLAQMHSAIKPGGGLIITVPQHRWLWSETDDAAHHVRRYERGEVERKLCKAASGFRILRSTSYTSLLLPVMMLSRLLRRGGSEIGLFAELQVSGWLNRALSSVMGLEVGLTRSGLNWPFGGSRVIVAQRI